VLVSGHLIIEQHFRSWQALSRHLARLRGDAKSSRLLFRGQADARWPLATTLQRRAPRIKTVLDYYDVARRVKPQVESFGPLTFDFPSRDALEQLLSDYDQFSLAVGSGNLPAYPFLIYLRHHGFPSPLLDWTRSAYIAAFFALVSPAPGVRRRAIYAWKRSRFRTVGSNKAEIKALGQYVTAHPRHVLQQCEYTISTRFDREENKWSFGSQEDVIAGADRGTLWKFTLSSTERPTALRYLNDFNLNAYSLFRSDESLLETLAIREFE
jgi:FRG domain